MNDRPVSNLFDDGKAPDALRTIGEVSTALRIKQHILRYWEQQFPSLQPLKRSGGRRYYRPEDVALVAEIDRLINTEGYTLKGAKQALKGSRAASGSGQAEQVSATVTDIVPRLKSIRERLAGALAA